MDRTEHEHAVGLVLGIGPEIKAVICEGVTDKNLGIIEGVLLFFFEMGFNRDALDGLLDC